MNKAELREALREETGLAKTKATEVVGLVFDTMAETLADGSRVEIRGFCSLFAKQYEAYTGRNPKTQASVQVPPKRLPFFKCGKGLKARVDS